MSLLIKVGSGRVSGHSVEQRNVLHRDPGPRAVPRLEGVMSAPQYRHC